LFVLCTGKSSFCLLKNENASDLGYIKPSQEIESLAVEIRRMLGTMLQKYGATTVNLNL